MLSAAKHLAALSMIGLDLSVDAELSRAFEPCLNLIIGQMEGQGYQDEFVKTHLIIALPGQKGKPKKYGANAPQLHPIRCSIDFCVMLCNEQAKNEKNTAQMRHSCAISCRQKEIDACQIHTGKRNSANLSRSISENCCLHASK